MPHPRSGLARLATTGRWMLSRLGRPREDSTSSIAGAISDLGADAGAVSRVHLRPGADWLDTGIVLEEGALVTLVADGRLWMSRALHVGCSARVALWYRIGATGHLRKAIDDSSTFVADASGPLHLVAKPPGEWLDETGRFDPAEPRTGMTGGLDVAVVTWRDASALSRAAAARPDGLFAREQKRLAEGVELPPGWRPLWRLGESGIYRQSTVNGRAAIRCTTEQNVGILTHACDVPLRDETRLRWSWRVHELPSAWPEDLVPTHDYLSIAVEFENGRDLTYLWSSALPVGTSFHCPLPWWDRRETHLVVRSGGGELGKWLDEERAPLADYRAIIGDPAPSRVVSVWLISVSVFQQGRGACDYSGISVGNGDRAVLL